MKKALTFQVYGLGGRNLNSEWEKEAVSYKGITVSGYPAILSERPEHRFRPQLANLLYGGGD